MRTRLSTRHLLFILIIALATTGCAHALSEPMPPFEKPLAVTVASGHLSKWDEEPLGVYQIPDTSVYISGHQGASLDVGIHFGLFGLAAANAAAKSTGEKKIDAVRAKLSLDMVKLTERVLADELVRRVDVGRFVPVGAAHAGSLEIEPYLVVNFIGNDQVRPWVILKAILKNTRGEEQWKTRYVSGMGELRPLEGASGWTADDGVPLHQDVDRNLRLAMDLLFRDAVGALPRKTGRIVKMKTQWVWAKERAECTAEILEETKDSLVVVPHVADVVPFAGVSILDKKTVMIQ